MARFFVHPVVDERAAPGHSGDRHKVRQIIGVEARERQGMDFISQSLQLIVMLVDRQVN